MPLTLKFARIGWSATWPKTLLTAAAVLAFVGLGRWQWQRADQAHALAAHFSAGTRATVVDLQRQPLDTLPRYAEVSVRGRYDGAHQFLLDNMSVQGMPGYEVLTPLILADGRSLIVNRGWVPLSESRQRLPDVPISVSDVAGAIGRLDNLPVAALALGHSAPTPGPQWPKLTSFPTMADLSVALGRPLAPRQLLLNPNQPLGYLRDWQPGGLTPDQHLSYAIQWWSFAALALVLYAVLNRRKAKR